MKQDKKEKRNNILYSVLGFVLGIAMCGIGIYGMILNRIESQEYKMLNLFRKNPRQVLTRGQLLEKLWDIDERFVDEHTLTTSISRIRSKIESDGGAPYIKTVYGMGYQWTGGEAK